MKIEEITELVKQLYLSAPEIPEDFILPPQPDETPQQARMNREMSWRMTYAETTAKNIIMVAENVLYASEESEFDEDEPQAQGGRLNAI